MPILGEYEFFRNLADPVRTGSDLVETIVFRIVVVPVVEALGANEELPVSVAGSLGHSRALQARYFIDVLTGQHSFVGVGIKRYVCGDSSRSRAHEREYHRKWRLVQRGGAIPGGDRAAPPVLLDGHREVLA